MASQLVGWGGHGQCEVAALLTSEIMTNAIVHGGPHRPGEGLGLNVQVFTARMRVELGDRSLRMPQPRVGNHAGESGRGLVLVDAMATRWGVVPTEDGKVVLFELDSTSPT